MGAPRKQYKLVRRYMNGTDTVYYGLVSSDGIERRFTEEQTYYLVGRNCVINVTGQLYRDKVLLRGNGVDIRSLPVVQLSKNENSRTRNTDNTKTPETKPSYDLKIVEVIKDDRQTTYKIVDIHGRTAIVNEEILYKYVSQNCVINARLTNCTGKITLRLKDDIPVTVNKSNTTQKVKDNQQKPGNGDVDILVKPIEAKETVIADVSKFGLIDYNDKQVVIITGTYDCSLIYFKGRAAKLNRNFKFNELRTFGFCLNQKIIKIGNFNSYLDRIYNVCTELDLNKSYGFYQNALQYTTTDFAYNIGDDLTVMNCMSFGSGIQNNNSGVIELIHKQKDRNIIHIVDPIPNGHDRYFSVSDTTIICLKAAYKNNFVENIRRNVDFNKHKFMRMHYHDIIVWMDNIIFMPEYKKLKLEYLKYNEEVFDNRLSTDVVLFAQ